MLNSRRYICVRNESNHRLQQFLAFTVTDGITLMLERYEKVERRCSLYQPASLDGRLVFSGNTVLTDSFTPRTTSDVCMSIDSGLVVFG